MRVAMSPWHRYTLAMERKLFASPWLRRVLCNSKMVRDDIKARFGLPDERLPVLYNAVDSNVFSPALRVHRERIRAQAQDPGGGDASTCWSDRAFGARACRRRSRRSRSCPTPRIS